ncbi:hypothetical protein [Stenotrophomonas sp. SMYL86]|nr:hypothetical protein [Stenotrophomonas sp. SMYL86]
MADHLATMAVRFAIVLGVFLFGITALWLGWQARRAAAWCWRRCAHG